VVKGEEGAGEGNLDNSTRA